MNQPVNQEQKQKPRAEGEINMHIGPEQLDYRQGIKPFIALAEFCLENRSQKNCQEQIAENFRPDISAVKN